MNRKDYDPVVLSTFDIIGCYFVDVFYNHLYLTASDVKSKAAFANGSGGNSRGRSLTDEYKSAVHAYITGVTKDERYYKKTITGLQQLYQTHTKFNTIGLGAFIDKIIETFLPEEYSKSMTDNEKEFFLSDIISSLVKEFASRVVDITHLTQIMDNHSSEHNTRAWVEEMVDLQIIEREKIFEKFTRTMSGRNGDHYEKIDVAVAQKIAAERDKIWVELEDRVKELMLLRSELSESKRLVTRMHSIIMEQNKRIKELESAAIQRVETPVKKQPRAKNIKSYSVSDFESRSADARSADTRSADNQQNMRDDSQSTNNNSASASPTRPQRRRGFKMSAEEDPINEDIDVNKADNTSSPHSADITTSKDSMSDQTEKPHIDADSDDESDDPFEKAMKSIDLGRRADE